jgi:hypothetical protein
MDCEKVRDRFSSLWEKELSPFEEKIIKEHLSSCPECQGEFEQFEKTMRWLHSTGEVEVPDEFLPGLYKKIEERKRALAGERFGGRWFSFPLSLKLPVQAAAMVAIVFLVLYLTKMMPMEGYRPKETGEPSPPLSVEKKSEEVLAQKEVEIKRRALETTLEAPRPKNGEQAKTLARGEEKLEGVYVPQMKAEAKKAEIPSSESKLMRYQAFDSKGTGRAKTPSPEPEEIEKELTSKEKSVVASKPPQEIVLRISDREKAISRLHKLIKEFGGEIVTTEGAAFIASLPRGSFSEFKKELAELSASTRTDKAFAKKSDTRDLMEVQGAKKEEVDEKGKGPVKLATDEELRMIVRIILIQE